MRGGESNGIMSVMTLVRVKNWTQPQLSGSSLLCIGSQLLTSCFCFFVDPLHIWIICKYEYETNVMDSSEGAMFCGWAILRGGGQRNGGHLTIIDAFRRKNSLVSPPALAFWISAKRLRWENPYIRSREVHEVSDLLSWESLLIEVIG